MKSVEFLINRGEIPGGSLDPRRPWPNAKRANAALMTTFRELVAAVPRGTKVNVTSHEGETVLHVSEGLERAQLEDLCARFSPYAQFSRSPRHSSADAAGSTPELTRPRKNARS